MGKQWKQWQTIFWGFKITADGDCSYEIKRCLLPGREAMTNLGSILRSKDITLPTKVRLVKAMVFPVVMYGCESCTIKKAEHQRIDAFELWCWRRHLRVPWTARRSNQSSLKEISTKRSLEGLMLKLKLQYFGHLMWRTDSFEKTLILGWERLKVGGEGDDRGWDSWTASLIQWTWVWASCGSWWWTRKPGAAVHGVAKSRTRLSDWTELNSVFLDFLSKPKATHNNFKVCSDIKILILKEEKLNSNWLMFLFFKKPHKGFCHCLKMKLTVEKSCSCRHNLGDTQRSPGNSSVSLSKSSGTSMTHSSPWDTASIMSCPCSRTNNSFLLSIRMRHLDVSQDSPEFCSLSLLSKMIPPFQPCLSSHHGGLVAKLCLTLATPWTVACQVPLSMGFSRQEYWSGLPFISPGDLPNPEIELGSPALQADSLLIKSPGKPIALLMYFILPLCMALGSSSLDCPFCSFLMTHNYSLFHA